MQEVFEKIDAILQKYRKKWLEQPNTEPCKGLECISNDCVDCMLTHLENDINQVAEECKNLNIDQDLTIVESLPSLYPLQPFEVEAIHRVVERAKYNDGWMPANEPPKKDGFYVVTFDGELCAEDAPFVGMCEFEDGEWMEDCILAWKEQAPYKPEGE